jgi:hypothetical protein
MAKKRTTTVKASAAKKKKVVKKLVTAKAVKSAKTAKTAKTSKKKVAVARPKKKRVEGSGARAEAVVKDESASPAKRKLGLRGAAPWAARHAAKHAAEARARAAEPAPPGSARATIRVPDDAEKIKLRVAELFNQTQKIRTLRKRLEKGFYEIGQVLAEIQHDELYLAKGFGSFEAFLEREIDLGKQTSLKLIKITHIFQQDAALDYGMDRLFAALAALEGESAIPKPSIPSAPGSRPMLPMKPPTMRIVG